MASQDRSTADNLKSGLVKDARNWSFFQAVEHLQRAYDNGTEVGTHLEPSDEKILFSVDHRLGFPVSEINAITSSGSIDPSEKLLFDVAFLGLHGSSSPLPSYYQETIARYDAEGSLLKGFFDFFHNRLISLMHRTMRKYRYYVRYRPEADDAYSQNMFCIFGLADQEARAQSPINWARLLTFAGILASRNRSPQVISSVVAHAFFHEDVHVEEWIQRKVDIPAEQRTSLGQQNAVLGQDVVIGDRVPDLASKFNIYLKNLSFERFQDFLPSGRDYKALRQLIEFMLRDQHAYDIKLGLAEGEARPLALTDKAEGHLGWSSFLGAGDAGRRDVLITARL
jgi:type VI secretion system protein ImpH